MRSKIAAFALVAGIAAYSSAPVRAASPAAVGAAAPAVVAPGASTLLSVAVTPGTDPASSGLFVSCNLSSIGGSFTQLFTDDGTEGDVRAGDLVFSNRATIDPTTGVGTRSLACVVSDSQGRVAVAQIALTVDASANQAPLVDPGGPYSVPEGQSVALAASGTDPEGGALDFAWDLDGDGVFETPGSTAGVAVDDGPATRRFAARASDPFGAGATALATVQVANVAPIAKLVAASTAAPGQPFSVGLTDPFDPSAADSAAGFEYAFDCGAGYSAWGDAASTTCSGPTAREAAVRAKIRDKDGGVSEYSRVVRASATFDGLCALTRQLSRSRHVAAELCSKLNRAARAKTSRRRARFLAGYRAGVRAHSGSRRRSAFSREDGARLIRLSRLL